MEEGPESPAFLGARLVVVAHPARGGIGTEHDREQRTRALHPVRHPFGVQRRTHNLPDLPGAPRDSRVDGVIGQGERRDSRRSRQRIAGERARLVDGPQRGEQVHDVGPAPEGRQRHPAAHHLAEGQQVRNPGGPLAPVRPRPRRRGGRRCRGNVRNAPGNIGRPSVQGLQAPEPGRTHAEAGEHLVGDHEGAVGRRHPPHRFVEAGHGRHDPHVRGRALEDDGGDVVAAHREALLQGGDVVIGQHDRLRRHRLRDPRGSGQAAGGHPGSGRREQPVAVPVVAAGELHHQVAAGRPARQADGRHGRLGAGGHEAHPFGRGHTAPHRLGQLGLGGGRRPEGQAAGCRLPYGLDDAGMGVPE